MVKKNLVTLLHEIATPQKKSLLSARSRGGWFPTVLEAFAGAWQRNIEINHDSVAAHHAVFACMTLIASDIAKLPLNFVVQDEDGIWNKSEKSEYLNLLDRPNHYQNRIQFMESWILSKLSYGNAYILKGRNKSGKISALYVLNPQWVRPLISTEDGSVYYQLYADDIVSLKEKLTVPAREIMHDRFNCLFHPLVGLSPIFASGLAATQGLRMQEHSAHFFGNNANPGGILTAPGEISDETAKRLKDYWEANYSGRNAGKIAVLGDDLKYQQLQIKATDSQLVEQLKWSAEVVCSTFHVPPYKIGVGNMPSYNNIQALNVEYYAQCLQAHIEAGELVLDHGLDILTGAGLEFDIKNLLRMDSTAQMEALDKAKGILTPNEQRRQLELKPVAGGDSPMMQQQNFSLDALAKRDAQENPFSTDTKRDTPPSEDDKAWIKAEERAMEAELQLAFSEGLEA